ncbi:hypothetical protein BH09MYX1_BH09MYX1_48730 [soil metagenome]
MNARWQRLKDWMASTLHLAGWQIVVLLVVVGVIIAIAQPLLHRPPDALERLPASEQDALYQRTMTNLKTICAQPDDGLEAYCREEAHVALRLPECDDTCRRLVSSRVEPPTR